MEMRGYWLILKILLYSCQYYPTKHPQQKLNDLLRFEQNPQHSCDREASR